MLKILLIVGWAWWDMIQNYHLIPIITVCSIFLVLIALRILVIVDKPIELPEKAHNIIGNIPIVEHYDDGKIESQQTGWVVPKRNSGYITTSFVTDSSISYGSYDSFSYGR